MADAADPISILVVDDAAASRRTLAWILEKRGHRAAEAGDAEAAIQASRRERYDLILLDVRLGGSSGLRIAPTLAAAESHPAVLLVTGLHEVEVVRQALGEGSYACLHVPFDPSSVAHWIGECGKPAVVAVEDDPGKAEGLALRLLSAGRRAAHVRDVDEALERIGGPDPATAVLDLPFPEDAGLSTRVSALRPGTPLVAIRALTAQDDAVRTASRGGVTYLRKPLDLNLLDRVLDAARCRRGGAPLPPAGPPREPAPPRRPEAAAPAGAAVPAAPVGPCAPWKTVPEFSERAIRNAVHDIQGVLAGLTLRARQVEALLGQAVTGDATAAALGMTALQRMLGEVAWADQALRVVSAFVAAAPVPAEPVDLGAGVARPLAAILRASGLAEPVEVAAETSAGAVVPATALQWALMGAVIWALARREARGGGEGGTSPGPGSPAPHPGGRGDPVPVAIRLLEDASRRPVLELIVRGVGRTAGLPGEGARDLPDEMMRLLQESHGVRCSSRVEGSDLVIRVAV